MELTQEIRPVRDEIIITAMKFITYLTAIFELRNANFLPILSPYGTFHCKLVLSCHLSIVCIFGSHAMKETFRRGFKYDDTK